MQNVNFARAIAFARTAADTSTTDGERDTATNMLAEHCAKHGINLADVIERAAQPDPTALQAKRDAKRANVKPASEAKPEPAAAKPTKPTADDAKRSADYDKREALVAELRAAVASLYNGPSLAIRSNPKRIAIGVYAALLATPKHRTDLAKLTARDESALREIIRRGTKAGAFDPSEINLDSGVFSRLASVGFLAPNDSAASPFKLTATGLAHARNVIKRAA